MYDQGPSERRRGIDGEVVVLPSPQVTRTWFLQVEHSTGSVEHGVRPDSALLDTGCQAAALLMSQNPL